MKYLLITLLLLPTFLFAQTSKMVPIFQMKVVQVAAIKNADNYTLNFYQLTTPTEVNKAVKDSALCTLSLSDGSNIYGNYVSVVTAMGHNVLTYLFTKNDFNKIANSEVVRVSCYTPTSASIGIDIGKKYLGNIEKVVESVL